MSLIAIINELVVSNIDNSIKFYCEILGFSIEYTDGEPTTWVQLKKDNLRIMLEDYSTVKKEIKEYPSKVSTSNLIKFEYDDLEEFNNLYDYCKKSAVSFFLDYTKTEYGKIEFGIFDLDKHMLVMSYKK